VDGAFCKRLTVPVPQYVRKTVAEMLCAAAETLPPEYSLILHEGWRSYERQSALFERQRALTVAAHPDWSDSEIDSYTHNFVAIPSLDALNPSPHATGGAVDVSISGLDMGCAFLEMSERARTDYYAADSVYALNRSLLKSAMESAGFVNFPFEWWHYEYGIDTWAKANRRSAIYAGKLTVNG
jgi:D-alanyl-D-alanine dipeptidase